jgi:hypothetical protein
MRNWVYYMQEGLKSMWKKKEVSDYKTLNNDDPYCYKMDCGNKVNILNEFCDIHKEKEYPYNIEFGDGRTEKEMDKMQKELMDCGCLPDCGCKE